MKKSQAYAGPLQTTRMVIPSDTVLLLYSPSGNPQVTIRPRKGQANWVLDFTSMGLDSTVAVDGTVWGTVQLTSSSGTIQYVYFARSLATQFKLDTVSPLLKGVINISGSVSISGTPSVSISGTPNVNISNTGAISVSISGTPSVDIGSTGSVNIGSITGGVTIPVSGTVSISGTPSVSISGTPSVSISSGTVDVSAGTVTVNGSSSDATLTSSSSFTAVNANASLTITPAAGTMLEIEAIYVVFKIVNSATSTGALVFDLDLVIQPNEAPVSSLFTPNYQLPKLSAVSLAVDTTTVYYLLCDILGTNFNYIGPDAAVQLAHPIRLFPNQSLIASYAYTSGGPNGDLWIQFFLRGRKVPL